jgi:hypothetical protein
MIILQVLHGGVILVKAALGLQIINLTNPCPNIGFVKDNVVASVCTIDPTKFEKLIEAARLQGKRMAHLPTRLLERVFHLFAPASQLHHKRYRRLLLLAG